MAARSRLRSVWQSFGLWVEDVISVLIFELLAGVVAFVLTFVPEATQVLPGLAPMASTFRAWIVANALAVFLGALIVASFIAYHRLRLDKTVAVPDTVINVTNQYGSVSVTGSKVTRPVVEAAMAPIMALAPGPVAATSATTTMSMESQVAQPYQATEPTLNPLSPDAPQP